jgi:hypothetical protein
LMEAFRLIIRKICITYFSNDKMKSQVIKICETFYHSNAGAFDRMYQRIQARKFTKTYLAKKLKAQKQKKPVPEPKQDDFTVYTAVKKPTIQTSKVLVTPDEKKNIAAINRALQTVGNVAEIIVLDQQVRKLVISESIDSLQAKCKAVTNILVSRKNKVHEILKNKYPKANGDSPGFTTEQWSSAFTEDFKHNDLTEVLIKEFGSENANNINLRDIINNIMESHVIKHGISDIRLTQNA